MRVIGVARATSARRAARRPRQPAEEVERRERTLLVEQAATDGRLEGQKTNRPPRSVELLAPLREDLTD